MKKSSDRGQTLMEIIVAVGVVAMLVTGLVVAVTTALRYSESGRLRSTGLKYAQEGIELARALRDKNTWNEFLAYGSESGQLWCVDASGAFASDDGFGECPMNIEDTYTRSVFLQLVDTTMEVTSTVTWIDAGQQTTSSLKTYLTKWR